MTISPLQSHVFTKDNQNTAGVSTGFNSLSFSPSLHLSRWIGDGAICGPQLSHCSLKNWVCCVCSFRGHCDLDETSSLKTREESRSLCHGATLYLMEQKTDGKPTNHMLTLSVAVKFPKHSITELYFHMRMTPRSKQCEWCLHLTAPKTSPLRDQTAYLSG